MVWVRSTVYFYKRNETFYVSRAIPSDLLHRFNKRKVDVSLRTKSEAKAAKSVAALPQGHLKSHRPVRVMLIGRGINRGNDATVHTFGVVGTIVTTADMPEHIVYKMVKSVFSNFDEFRTLHPALASLTKKQMIRTGLTAPLHPGALKYYREAGLMK